jgi:hypothetical protein
MQAWDYPQPRRLPTAEEVRGTRREVEELDGELRTLRTQISFLERRVSQILEQRARRMVRPVITSRRRLTRWIPALYITVQKTFTGHPHSNMHDMH